MEVTASSSRLSYRVITKSFNCKHLISKVVRIKYKPFTKKNLVWFEEKDCLKLDIDVNGLGEPIAMWINEKRKEKKKEYEVALLNVKNKKK